MTNHNGTRRDAQMEEFPRAKPARYDRLGDLYHSDVFIVVRNSTDRRVLQHSAIRSHSVDRAHWYSDAKTALEIGVRHRETVNRAHARVQDLGLEERRKHPKRRSRLTVLADFPALANIADAHKSAEQLQADKENNRQRIKPAPTPTGTDWPRFPEAILDSHILGDLPGVAGDLYMLYAWGAQADPNEPDFAQFTISDVTAGAILHRDPRNIRDARKILMNANLIARDGKTITLLAHTAAEIAKRRPAKTAQAGPFTEEDKKRRKRERAEAKQGHLKATNRITASHIQDDTKPDHGVTQNRITASHILDHGVTHTPDHGVTQNHYKEPQKRTIRENHKGASGNGQINFCNGNGSTNGAAASTETKPAKVFSANDIWIKAQEELAQEMPVTTFETWIRDTSARSYSQGNLIIDAPNKYARAWLRHRLTKKAEQALRRSTGADITVTFEIRGQPDPKTETTHPNDTAGTATLSQPPEGRHSDDGPVDDAADDSPQPEPEPEPQAQANQAPDLLRQAQDASREERTAWMKHWQSRCRDHREWQPTDTWIPVGSDHRKDAAQVARSP